jgi:type IV secretion system protein VirB8
MLGKKKDTVAVQQAAQQGVSYEIAVGDLARKSERRAWLVAFASMALTLLLAGGYYYMLPLKEKVPYVVIADPLSGVASVASLRDEKTFQQLTSEEALTRSNVAQYVISRESYDIALMNLRDWRVVHSMSVPPVAAEYRGANSELNPDSPFKRLGVDKAIRVRVLSITPIDSGVGGVGMQVRFQRSLYDKREARLTPMDNRVATLMYMYDHNLAMEEEDRFLNPLGFQVTQYRVDVDRATTPNLGDESLDRALGELPVAVSTPSTGAVAPGTTPIPPPMPGPPAQAPLPVESTPPAPQSDGVPAR